MRKPIEQGFVMVLALVVLTVLFAAAGGLAVSRQMWGLASTKGLDRSVVEASARADSAAWFSSLRDTLQLDGNLNLVSSPVGVLGEVPAVLEWSDYGQLFRPVTPYPTYPPSQDMSPISLSWTFSLVDASQPSRMGPYDPYWGVESNMAGFGVLFSQEMSGEGRVLRDDRFSSSSSQLRAWMSIDGALSVTTGIRVFPASVFTLFCSQSVSGASDLVGLGSSWLNGSAAPYSSLALSGGDPVYSTDALGMGRIYVEGTVRADTNVSFGFPLVATAGVVGSANSYSFYFPGGGSVTRALSGVPDYLRARYAELGGMFLMSAEVPQRLLRPGLVRGGDGYWRSRSLSDVDGVLTYLAASSAAAVVVNAGTGSISVSSANPSLFDVGVAAQRDALTSNSVWTVDSVAHEVVFHPPSGFFDGFTKAPTSLSIEVVDASGVRDLTYAVRLRVPSVAGLSLDSDRQKLSLTSFHALILEDGFNSAGGDHGSLVGSPVVYVAPSGPVVPGLEYVVRGVVLTEAFSPAAPFRSYGGYVAPVALTGSLLIWSRLPSDPGGTLGVRLSPDAAYLEGVAQPPVVPAVLDLRVSAKNMNLYEIRAR